MIKLGNNMIVLGEGKEGKKEKKGNGIFAILTLTREVMEFQTRVQECIDAQDLSENRSKIEAFNGHLNDLYTELAEMISANPLSANVTPQVQKEEKSPAVKIPTIPTSIVKN